MTCGQNKNLNELQYNSRESAESRSEKSVEENCWGQQGYHDVFANFLRWWDHSTITCVHCFGFSREWLCWQDEGCQSECLELSSCTALLWQHGLLCWYPVELPSATTVSCFFCIGKALIGVECCSILSFSNSSVSNLFIMIWSITRGFSSMLSIMLSWRHSQRCSIDVDSVWTYLEPTACLGDSSHTCQDRVRAYIFFICVLGLATFLLTCRVQTSRNCLTTKLTSTGTFCMFTREFRSPVQLSTSGLSMGNSFISLCGQQFIMASTSQQTSGGWSSTSLPKKFYNYVEVELQLHQQLTTGKCV